LASQVNKIGMNDKMILAKTAGKPAPVPCRPKGPPKRSPEEDGAGKADNHGRKPGEESQRAGSKTRSHAVIF
jgi:hypothetical protein